MLLLYHHQISSKETMKHQTLINKNIVNLQVIKQFQVTCSLIDKDQMIIIIVMEIPKEYQKL